MHSYLSHFSARVFPTHQPIGLHIAGVVCALSFFYLSASSQYYGDSSVVELLLVSACVGLTTLLLIACYCRCYFSRSVSCSTNLSSSISILLPIKVIVFWACIFRLMGFFSYPILEDDHFRFLWDGYQTVTAGSPYIAAPATFFDVDLPERFEDILGAINYPEVPTIYAPVTQAVFALAYLIAPGQIWALKLLLLVFDIGLLLLLAYWLTRIYRNGQSVKAVYQRFAFLLYAWSPLLIKETAFTAHPDIIGVFFLMAAVICRCRYRCHGGRSGGGTTIFFVLLPALLCALAAASKIFALIIIPFVLQFYWRRWLIFAISLCLLFLPFANDLLHWSQSLQTMGAHWLFNAPIYLAFTHIAPFFSSSMSAATYFSNMALIKQLSLFVFVGLWLWYAYGFVRGDYYRRQGVKAWVRLVGFSGVVRSPSLVRGDYLYGIFFLAIPVLNPWYLVWLLPFAVIYPSYWAWTASFAVLLSYIIGLNIDDPSLGPYDQPAWAVILEYSLILLALAYGKCRGLPKGYKGS